MDLSSLKPPIFVAGHRGMVGAAVVRRLAPIGRDVLTMDRSRLDLRDSRATSEYLVSAAPKTVVMAAARVGGIAANQAAPVSFLSDNLRMAVNVLEAAHAAGVQRLLFLGSTCIYPRECRQPMHESDLLSGPLEPTNEAYALAKIAGVKLCQYYRRQQGVMFHSAMPTNLYGPGDNYDPENSHVLAALLRRFHEAKQAGAPEVVLWGTGTPRREFLHVDDLADAVVHLLTLPDPPDWVNVGTGAELSIMELAKKIAALVGFEGRIVLDRSRPDGTPAKRTDVTRLHQLGWRHRIDLDSGLKMAYQSFLSEIQADRLRSK